MILTQAQKSALIQILTFSAMYPVMDNTCNPEIVLIMIIFSLLPCHYSSLSLRQRIFPHVDNNWPGIDCYTNFISHPYEFYLISGETEESFTDLFNDVSDVLQENTMPILHRLSLKNQLLLTLIWLRSYPCYSMLSICFGISMSTVSNIISRVWPRLWRFLIRNQRKIRWPSVEEWNEMRGEWDGLSSCVGSIDGTSHEIYRPIENQALFYSGYRGYHCVHTQIITDVNNNLVLVRSGFPGHLNDAQQFTFLPNIGPNGPLHFPENTFILADKIYPCVYPLMTPFTNTQIRRRQLNYRHRMRSFNKKLNEKRIFVEHLHHNIKMYRVIGSLYRHSREDASYIVELCAALAHRRLQLFSE